LFREGGVFFVFCCWGFGRFGGVFWGCFPLIAVVLFFFFFGEECERGEGRGGELVGGGWGGFWIFGFLGVGVVGGGGGFCLGFCGDCWFFWCWEGGGGNSLTGRDGFFFGKWWGVWFSFFCDWGGEGCVFFF